MVKRYAPFEGTDYKESLSTLAMHKSIGILLSITTHFDNNILKMNVKTIFTNDELDKQIFMDQPDNFIGPSKEHMVCKL